MKTFILPSDGNSITAKDIEKSTLRITVDFKAFFPTHNATTKLCVNGQWHQANYRIRDGKSSILKIEKEVMNHLQLQANQSLKFEELEFGVFKVSKVN